MAPPLPPGMSRVYENTGYNKDLYEKIKNAILNSKTEEEMMSSLYRGSSGGSLLGGAMSFTTSNAKTYIDQADKAIQHNIAYKEEQRRKAEEEEARRKAEEQAKLSKPFETDYDVGFGAGSPLIKETDSFYVPEGTKRIGNYALRDCRVKNIVLPETVTSIGEFAFDENDYVESIRIPQSVTHIGAYAFMMCKNLNKIELPNNLTRIEEGTFAGTGLTSIEIPNLVSYIGNFIFDGSKLTMVRILSRNVEIEELAFQNPTNLTKIIVPKGTKQRFEKMEALKGYEDIIFEE